MPVVTSHDPGTFCWVELSTSDRKAASDFYSDLFGWTPDEIPMGDAGVYVMLKKDGKDVAALYENKQGPPPHWASYVSVDSADSAAEKAKSLGGNVVAGPFDVMDVGRMAFVTDPGGATFAVWEPRTHIGATVVGEPGTLCWNELMTANGDAARSFYAALFGWSPKTSPEYTEWHVGSRAIGGMMEMKGEQWGGVPPHWMPYFAVTDCNAAAERVKTLRGAVIVGPGDIPNVGRFAVVNDPQGATFAMFQPKEHGGQ